MSRNKGKQEERRKIQIDVTEDARLRLEAILERTPTASRNELFQRALQLLEWAIDEKRAGSRVMVADDRGALKKLEFPFLESVTPQPDLAPELSVETVGATTNIHISLIDPAVYSAIQQHPELAPSTGGHSKSYSRIYLNEWDTRSSYNKELRTEVLT